MYPVIETFEVLWPYSLDGAHCIALSSLIRQPSAKKRTKAEEERTKIQKRESRAISPPFSSLSISLRDKITATSGDELKDLCSLANCECWMGKMMLGVSTKRGVEAATGRCRHLPAHVSSYGIATG